MPSITHKWWKEGVCYQVWPASLKDSNDDGHGDLQGLISKLDYLKDFGVDFIWLSPCYAPPKHDQGHDVSNYEDIDPDFGTLQDMDDLSKGVHDRGMRLLLDLVVNHTSDEHKWFRESAKSRDSGYSDYVLHLERPEDSERLRQALYDSAIRFWLDRGIDGFRNDACNIYSKPLDFADAEVIDPTAEFHGPPPEIVDGPRMHGFLQEQRKEALDPYDDVVLIGELGLSRRDNILKYLDQTHRELDMIFDMNVVQLDGFMPSGRAKEKSGYGLLKIRQGLAGPQEIISDLDRWSSIFLENHDNPRSISKFGSFNPDLQIESGKCLALLLCTLSGTFFLYQGQEIGMSNLPKSWLLSDVLDKWWLGQFDDIIQKHGVDSEKMKVAKANFESMGRDHSRTPVQWTNETSAAGFSKVEPWIKVNSTCQEGITVREQQDDPNSLRQFWKRSLALRKGDLETYVHGTTEFLDLTNDKVMYFTKRSEAAWKPNVLVVLNFTDDKRPLRLPFESGAGRLGKVLLSTKGNVDDVELAPREGRIYELLSSV